MEKSISDFIIKYQSKYDIEIVLIKETINSDVYNIDLDNSVYTNIFNKLNKDISPEERQIHRYYHSDCYMDICNSEICVKKVTIIDKLYINNFLIIAKQIEDLDEDCIPGLYKYDREDSENWLIFNIKNINIIFKSIKNNSKNNSKNIYININQESIPNILNTINSFIL